MKLSDLVKYMNPEQSIEMFYITGEYVKTCKAEDFVNSDYQVVHIASGCDFDTLQVEVV